MSIDQEKINNMVANANQNLDWFKAILGDDEMRAAFLKRARFIYFWRADEGYPRQRWFLQNITGDVIVTIDPWIGKLKLPPGWSLANIGGFEDSENIQLMTCDMAAGGRCLNETRLCRNEEDVERFKKDIEEFIHEHRPTWKLA